MSSQGVLCKIMLALSFGYTTLYGIGNILPIKSIYSNNNIFIDSDSLQTFSKSIRKGKHYLDNRFVIALHQGDLLSLPTRKKLRVFPQLFFKSNYFSKEIWGGHAGTGITVGLNFFSPYFAFSPEWRKERVYVNTIVGLQLTIGGSIAGIGSGLLPFGQIAGGYSFPLSKKIVINSEIGASTIQEFEREYLIFPYLNLGIIYRKHN